MLNRVLVVGESVNGEVTAGTSELLTLARSVAEQVEVIAWGDNPEELARELSRFGADVVHELGDLGNALPGQLVARAVDDVTRSADQPALVLFGSTCDGREIAGRVSARLDRPVLTNVAGIQVIEDGLVLQQNSAGSVITAEFTGAGPWLVVNQMNTIKAEPSSGRGERRALPIDPGMAAGGAHVVASRPADHGGHKLEDATVVVSGGLGLGSESAFELIAELAALLGGAPGATRAAVDAGWVPYSQQVGLTGRSVRPELYIACGISGAVQHLVGMRRSRSVIAINTDPEAPIFKVADLGIVADVRDCLPRVIEMVKQLDSGRTGEELVRARG